MNYLLIAVLVKYAELREDRTVLFKISLSLADAVDLRSGLTVLPIGAVFCSRVISRVQHLTQYLPKINIVCLSIFGFASMQSQAWVAFSKMVSVSKQLRYELSIAATESLSPRGSSAPLLLLQGYFLARRGIQTFAGLHSRHTTEAFLLWC